MRKKGVGRVRRCLRVREGVERELEVWSDMQELKERDGSVTVVSEGKSDGDGEETSELSSTTEEQ